MHHRIVVPLTPVFALASSIALLPAVEPALSLSDAIADSLLANCGSCKVDLDVGWDLGHIGTPADVVMKRWVIGLRYDQFDQDRIYGGRTRVDLPPGSEGIRHRVTTLDVDYRINANLTVNVGLPWVDREQREVEIDETDPTTSIASRGDFSGIGDVRLGVQYLISLPGGQRAGMVIGLKLPTGSTTKESTEITSTNGVEVSRDLVPTTWTLNPGNGATEGLLGAIWRADLLGHQLVFFARPQIQFAIVHKEEFRPGNRFSLNAGTRYQISRIIDVSLQATGEALRSDGGERAEPEESGGEFVTVSPGIAVYPIPDWQLFANYLWQPYRRVNGEQYVMTQGFSLGTAARF